MSSGGGFAFGPYRLDVGARRLTRGGADVPLTPRQFDLLRLLVSRAGQVLSKNVLIREAWQDVSVTDNNLVQVVRQLRLLLDADDADGYIKTESRDGYRFAAPVTPVHVRRTDADLEALLAPHRAWLDGRAALETLERAGVARARATFEDLVRHHPDESAVHIGLANACVLQFEATRADAAPDQAALGLAAAHAREACRLDANAGEAWATLGFVLERTGDRPGALAALRRAATLEPDRWLHQLRLSAATWGEERLRAARRTLALVPDSPLAHWLAATVYVARGAPAEAERELDAGLDAMPGESAAPPRFSAVALHYLKGLLCLARGADADALDAFRRELAIEPRGHLYGRECAANMWYAIGARHLHRGERAAAQAAFDEALARVAGHAMALAGLALLGRRDDVTPRGRDLAALSAPIPVDVAIARAVPVAAAGDASGAARLVGEALASAPAGNAGWILPIEPLIRVDRDRPAWREVLALLRSRAT